MFNHVLSWNVVPYFSSSIVDSVWVWFSRTKTEQYCFFLGLYLRAKVSAALSFPVLSAHVGKLVNWVLVDNLNQGLCVLYETVMCPVYVLHIIYQCVADSMVLWCLSGTKCLPVWPLVSNWSFHLSLNKLLSHISWVLYRSLRLNGWVWDWKNKYRGKRKWKCERKRVIIQSGRCDAWWKVCQSWFFGPSSEYVLGTSMVGLLWSLYLEMFKAVVLNWWVTQGKI